MILRRLTTALRKQDWFTVLIETLIVVLGVFLGLQAQQWAADRELRVMEAAAIARLREEVVELQALRGPIVAYRRRWSAGLDSLTEGLYGEAARPITDDECVSLAFASVVTNPTDDLATLIELQESGGLSRIRDQQVLAALRGFLLARARARDSRDGISASVRDVVDRYPSLIRMVPSEVQRRAGPRDILDADVFPGFECDREGMLGNQAFLNDLEWTRLVLSQHLDDNETVDQSLAGLLGALNAVLGISGGTNRQ